MSKMGTFLHILESVGPLVLMAIPGPAGDIVRAITPKIIDGITEAQQMPGASGVEKKAHVMDIVQDGLDSLNSTGKIQLPVTDVLSTASTAIDTIIGAAHVVDGTHKATPKV